MGAFGSKICVLVVCCYNNHSTLRMWFACLKMPQRRTPLAETVKSGRRSNAEIMYMIGFTVACHRYRCMETISTKNLQISVGDKSELLGSQKLYYGDFVEGVHDVHWFEQLRPTLKSFCRRSFFLHSLRATANEAQAIESGRCSFVLESLL